MHQALEPNVDGEYAIWSGAAAPAALYAPILSYSYILSLYIYISIISAYIGNYRVLRVLPRTPEWIFMKLDFIPILVYAAAAADTGRFSKLPNYTGLIRCGFFSRDYPGIYIYKQFIVHLHSAQKRTTTTTVRATNTICSIRWSFRVFARQMLGTRLYINTRQGDV